jgi:hypothetical protein
MYNLLFRSKQVPTRQQNDDRHCPSNALNPLIGDTKPVVAFDWHPNYSFNIE